jgi:hypothetical protein
MEGCSNNHAKIWPVEVRATERMPPKAIEWTESKKRFGVGRKAGFSCRKPRRPPSPLPRIQKRPSARIAEWNRNAHGPPQSLPICCHCQQVGQWLEKERKSKAVAGDGWSLIYSMPPTSWSEAPLPRKRALTGTLLAVDSEEKWLLRVRRCRTRQLCSSSSSIRSSLSLSYIFALQDNYAAASSSYHHFHFPPPTDVAVPIITLVVFCCFWLLMNLSSWYNRIF